MYHYTDGGLRNVWLANGYKVQRTPHGEGVSFDNLDGLIAAICKALVTQLAPLSGAEFRYLRCSGLMQSQAGLAKLLGNNEQAVARWEKSGKVPRWADKLLRVLYLGHAQGDARIHSVVETINAIERAAHCKVVLHASRKRWRATAEPVAEAL